MERSEMFLLRRDVKCVCVCVSRSCLKLLPGAFFRQPFHLSHCFQCGPSWQAQQANVPQPTLRKLFAGSSFTHLVNASHKTALLLGRRAK